MSECSNQDRNPVQEALCGMIESQPMKKSVVVVAGLKAAAEALAAMPCIARREGHLIGLNLFDEQGRGHGIDRAEFRSRIGTEGFAAYITLVDERKNRIRNLLADGSVDLVFIHDGGGYERTRTTILDWLPKLAPTGIIAGCLESLPGRACGYAGLLPPAPTGCCSPGKDPFGGLRAVMELCSKAAWNGPVWRLQRGEGTVDIARITSILRRSIETQQAASQEFREFYCTGFRMARDCADQAAKIAMLEQLVREYPGSMDPHLMLGGEYLALQRPDLAIDVYERALKNGTGNPTIYSYLGMAHSSAGDDGAAEMYFRTALRLDHETISAWLNLLILYVNQGEMERARECLEHALTVVPPDQETTAILARVSMAINDGETMRNALEKLSRLDPQHPLVQKLRAALEPAGSGWRDPRERFVEDPIEVGADNC